jgi:hypothetical protein
MRQQEKQIPFGNDKQKGQPRAGAAMSGLG